MSDRSLQTTIKALRRDLRDVEHRRAKIVAALQALEALPAMEDGAAPTGKARKRIPKSGGSPLIAGAVTVLRTAGEPMHIMALVTALQQNSIYADRTPDKVRASLVSAMIRRNDVFSKPPGRRGMYGLKEWDK